MGDVLTRYSGPLCGVCEFPLPHCRCVDLQPATRARLALAIASGRERCARFNAAYPVGTAVLVATGLWRLRKTRTASAAFVLGDGTPVVKIDGDARACPLGLVRRDATKEVAGG